MSTTKPLPADLSLLHPRLEIAASVALEAGAILTAAWGQTITIEEKSHGDLVSAVDREIDTLITKRLSALTPGVRIISEESWDGVPIDHRDCWVVDPLDGSTAFLLTNDPALPSVLIALVENGVVGCSVIYFPLSNDLYYAAKGAGAWHNGVLVDWRKQNAPLRWLRMNHYSDSRYESPFFARLRDQARQPGGAALVTVVPPSAGIACRLRSGEALVHDDDHAKLKQGCWDIAAPSLWITEAGGAIGTPDGGAIALHESGPILVASSPAILQQLVTLGGVS